MMPALGIRMKKKIVAAGLVALLAAGGAYGYKQHQRTEVISSVSPAVKNASIRVLNSSKFETEKTSVTFKELFDRLEADTAEIEKRNIDVQSLANKDNADITEPAVAYMRDCQEFSRTLSMKYRKTLAFSNAVDRLNDVLGEPMPSSDYGFELRKNRRDKAMEEMNTASAEARAAAIALVAATKRLKETRTRAAPIFPDDALVSTAQLDAVIKTNSEEAKANDKAKSKS
jgi:hypothetical protein